jgi:hypothetical protein
MRCLNMMVSAVGVLLIAAVPQAGATEVEFSTTGIFTPGGTNTLTFLTNGGVGFQNYVQYTGVTAVDVAASPVPVSADLGNFFVAVLKGTETTATGTFTLTIDQTTPGPSSGSLPSTLSGTITRLTSGGTGPEGSSGEFVLTFTNPTLVINGVQYSIAGLGAGGLASDQLGLPLYNNQINADVTTVTPEPSFLWLTGAGFACLSLMAVRRHLRG